MPTLAVRPTVGPNEYPELVTIWRSAVDATHDFLSPQDKTDIETKLASDYFPQVDIFVAERDGLVVGFVGIADQYLEMLFVHADSRSRGVGTALLSLVTDHYGVRSVDVNEQNSQAVEFYKRRGFVVEGRSEEDDQGRPYPILRLRLTTQ